MSGGTRDCLERSKPRDEGVVDGGVLLEPDPKEWREASMSADEYGRLRGVVVGLAMKYWMLPGIDMNNLIQEGWLATIAARNHYYGVMVPSGKAWASCEAYCSSAVLRKLLHASALSRCPVSSKRNRPGLIMGIRTAPTLALDALDMMPGGGRYVTDGPVDVEVGENARTRAATVRRVLAKYDTEMDELAIRVLMEGRTAKDVADDEGLLPRELQAHVRRIRKALAEEPDLAELAAEGRDW